MNVLLLSHKADPDGITPVMLGRLAFPTLDTILLEPHEVDPTIKELVEQKKLADYDQIFIVDLCPTSVGADLLIPYQDKVQVLDHHFGKLAMNRYPFIQVVDTDEQGIKQSGTSLFYDYLKKNVSNPNLLKESVATFVDLVRSGDTWEWKAQNRVEAKWLGDLFRIFGRDYFEEHYYQYFLSHEEFSFTEQERYLLEIEEVRFQNYLKQKEEELIPTWLDGHPVGVVFAEQYRSMLGNVLAEKYREQYDYIILINVARSISYRGVKELDLSQIAEKYGGGGHQHAGGSPLPVTLTQQILTQCFPDIKIGEKPQWTLVFKKTGF